MQSAPGDMSLGGGTGTARRHTDVTPSSSSRSPSASSVPVAGPGAAKRRRNNAGVSAESCLTCRARKGLCHKVKCAGRSTAGPCTNCSRLDLDCSFVHASGDQTQSAGKVSRTLPSRSLTEAGTARKRAQRACHQCHIHKTKCSGDLPACKRCAGAGLTCEYMPAKRRFATVPHNAAAEQQVIKTERDIPYEETPPAYHHMLDVPQPNIPVPSTERASSYDDSDVEQLMAEKSLLNQQIIIQHCHVWFEMLHPVQCYAFLHPQTTIKMVEERRFTSIVAAGVCSITGLFISPDDAGRSFAERCNLWVKFHLSRTAGVLTKERLTLLVLSSIYDLIIGDWPKVWEYSATASRIITAMQYNWDYSSGSFIEQESIRRLVWEVYIIDRFLAGGYSEHLTLREENLHLALPCDDYSFRNNQPVGTGERLGQRPLPAGRHQGGNVSLLSINLRLMSLRHQLLGTTKRYAAAPSQHAGAQHTEPSVVMSDIQKLQARLHAIKDALPENAQVSEVNIRRYFGTPEWSTFLMVHTWMFQLHLDLYRFSLPGIREQANSDILRVLPPDFLAKCRCQAIAFAITQARFWETSQIVMTRHPQSRQPIITADFSLGICVIECTKILMIARQYRMFFDLQDHSTVPPFRNERVDDDVLAGLIDSNIGLLDHLERVIPKVRVMSKDVREAVASYRSSSDIDAPSLMGMPFVQPPDDIRLPGPHYVLENVHAMQTVDDEANRQRSASLADQDMRKRSGGSSRGSQFSASPPVHGSKQPGYNIGRPDVPFYLSRIRDSNAVPLTTTAGETSDHGEQHEQVPHHQHHHHQHHHHHPQQQQQQQQPVDPLASNFDFDMAGVLMHIPTFPLVSPEAHMSIPATSYDMAAPLQAHHQLAHDVLSPQEQHFMLAQQQHHHQHQQQQQQHQHQQLSVYGTGYGDPHEASGGHVFEVPYREYG